MIDPMVSAAVFAGRFEKLVGLADLQVIKEDLVQLVIVVLPGMDQDMLDTRGPARRSPGTAG